MGGHHTTTKAEHSAKYSTHLERARHGGFQILDLEHKTNSRRALDQPPGTATETDEDEDRRRRHRRAKTETDEDGLTQGTSEAAAPLQLTTPQSDEDEGRRGQRQTKTKTDSLWGRAKWQLLYS